MMCEHGDTVTLRVPVPADLAYEGELTWKDKPVDRCLAPLVDALNAARIYTAGSCCGHGEGEGSVPLHDGRTLIVQGTTEEHRDLRDDHTHGETPAPFLHDHGPVFVGATQGGGPDG